ncbi:YcaO-like family protein [Lysinibacillus sp. NPDC093197]|uniref:YcaO-like family protein n=1 Tax=Lysinibacillus sp. NPDC093197 TaxID=3364132 RepID=UPI003814F8A6
MGFLLNSTRYFSDRGVFLNHHFNNFMIREDKMEVKAYEVGFKNRRKNIQKVLGEFFEREILINNNDSKIDYKFSNSLLNGEKKSVAKNKLIAKDKFVDSCGMAAHTSSYAVIKNAFLEFFERQSLIVNYLTKTPEDSINISKFHSFNTYLLNYVDNVYYYNISLSPKVFVILTLGIGKVNKCTGLGTSFILEEAIKKSQIEALQYFATKHTKECEIDFDKNDDIEQKDLYHKKFDSITIPQFRKLYHYLLETESTIIRQTVAQLNSEFLELLDWCNINLKMNPMISMFPSHRKIPHLKIVKVFDTNWFPHLNPSLYTKENIDNVSKIIGKRLDYNIDWIPFP